LAPRLFEPWARELVRFAVVQEGASVLDVASGPGTVARVAAEEVGPSGEVVASDISAAMLAVAASTPARAGSAPVSFLECSANALEEPDGSFQFVLCQQGLQFFPDRAGALAEMRRVLAPNGVVALACWDVERPLGLFGAAAEAVQESGLAEPFPRAYDPSSYGMSGSELTRLVEEAGFDEVEMRSMELECTWPTGADAIASLPGTVFGPALTTLEPRQQDRIAERFLQLLDATREEVVSLSTASNLARGVKRR
jgi:SAM-dependent methyltransferase